MLRFYAQSFVSPSATITQLVQIMNRGKALRDSHYKNFGMALGELMRDVEKVELPMTLAQKRIKELLDDPQDYGTFCPSSGNAREYRVRPTDGSAGDEGFVTVRPI